MPPAHPSPLSEGADSAPGAPGTPRTERRLPPSLEALVAEALGPVEDEGRHALSTLAALAMALSEAGIPAKAVMRVVALDPEHWHRPPTVYALKIKGIVTDGAGAYGWPALFERERQRLGVSGDYVDGFNVSYVDWDTVYRLNKNQAGAKQPMEDRLSHIRAVVQQWRLKAQLPPASPPRRRPSL